MRWWTEMFIAYFPAIGALILPLIQRKERGFLQFWPMRCLINPDLRFITKLLWILELFSVHRRLLIVCFALWPIAAQLYRKGLVMQLPVKRHKTKTSNRYFNYIYVRMGACTFIHKRTADDIWKNLFELPLIEADKALSEEEFLSSASFRLLLAEGECPEVRSVLPECEACFIA